MEFLLLTLFVMMLIVNVKMCIKIAYMDKQLKNLMADFCTHVTAEHKKVSVWINELYSDLDDKIKLVVAEVESHDYIKGGYTADFKQKVMDSLKAGTSLKDASAKYGVGLKTLSKWRKELGDGN